MLKNLDFVGHNSKNMTFKLKGVFMKSNLVKEQASQKNYYLHKPQHSTPNPRCLATLPNNIADIIAHFHAQGNYPVVSNQTFSS